jgi:TRAP-type uncharacterized transport system substrate-binding protein
MSDERKGPLNRLIAPFMEIFGLSHAVAIATVLFIGAMLVAGFFWFFHSAPPHELVCTSGPPGSSFETNALKYARVLARNGVRLNLLPSEGSLQNLQRLEDPAFKVDIGFVQGGISNGVPKLKPVSLGSVAYEPLLVFYRGSTINLLSELKGKRLAIGPVGSGTRSLALTLLHLNEIDPGESTALEDLDAADAANALLKGSVDAVFLMGDSASPQIMRQLLLSPEVHVLSFTQADGYCRRIPYLNKLELPQGSIDFGKNIPSQNVLLIGPTVELLARRDLHPALCDLLIEAAQEVHGNAGLFKRKNEFPAPLEHEYPISQEASRYYKSGKSFLYRSLPFWLASLVNRVLVAFVPVVVLLVPALRVLPTLLRLRVRLRIYRWYRALLALEHDLQTWPADQRPQLVARLDHIETQVNRMKVPASFADQFYTLRGSIGFVRERIALTFHQPPQRH